MTFDERVRALAGLGFSEPQTRFIVTVALHSGFCLRRHYTAFAGLKYGQGVRDFLDRLVTRRLARRLAFRRDRGHVYHVHNSAIYDAIGQDGNRNRRRTSAALIARKLMLFDYVLDTLADEWYVTEQDKVALFTTRFGVPQWDLPLRGYGGSNSTHTWGPTTTIRYFAHKLPIFATGDLVTFAFLVTDTSGEAFRQFLQDHLRLFNRLPRWRIVVVAPCHIPGVPACELVMRRLSVAADRRPDIDVEGLRTYFTIRERADRNDFNMSMEEIKAFHAARVRFRTSEFEGLFQRWRSEGDSVLADTGAKQFREARQSGRGAFETYWLPLRYDRFGTRPGVS